MKKVLGITILGLFTMVIVLASTVSAEMTNSELTKKIGEIEERLSGIDISGTIEFEAGFESSENSSSDFSTATVDLAVEGEVNEYITGSFVFTYNSDDDGIELDEAIIAIASEGYPGYANLGYFVLPFGNFNTRFISDTITKYGETKQNAVTVGYSREMFDVSLSLFNGHVNEDGEDDDHISKFVLAGSVIFPENDIAKVSMGASIISDISEADGFEEAIETAGGKVKEFTMGYSIYLSAEFMEKFFFDVEYLAAADEIEYGAAKMEPKMYHIELGAAPVENVECAIRYEAGDDIEEESRYGAVVSWAVLDNTTLTGEFLRTDFEDDNKDSLNTFTAQIAVEF
ncbi:MAG: hypothetical protein CSA18_04070 [Deltaproteobacteria bacterium]|nr:MAG: hypothetical protein CSA18_04070 [Deltaproteobacteria bacterium]